MKLERVAPEPIESYLLRRAQRAEDSLARLRRMVADLDQMARDGNPHLAEAVSALYEAEKRST